MTLFKKTFVGASRFDRFAPPFTGSVADLESPVTTIKFSVTIDADSIFLVVTNEETDLLVLDFEIPFEIIKENSAFGDQTIWAIKDTLLDLKCAPGSPVERYVLTQQDIINVGTSTAISKDPVIFKEQYNDYYSPIRIFVPSKNSTIDDLTIVIIEDRPTVDSIHPNTIETVPTGLELVENEAKPLESWKLLLATITTTGPATVNADEVVDLNIQCSDTSVTEVFVEPIIGAVNKTRVLLNNGQGSLKLNTFGLSTGDQVDIKFGYKYFTGISRYTKTVS
jgi:hypothetical protein